MDMNLYNLQLVKYPTMVYFYEEFIKLDIFLEHIPIYDN